MPWATAIPFGPAGSFLIFSPISRMSRGAAAQPVLALWFARLWRLLQCVFGPCTCTTEHIAAGTRNAFAYWSHGVTVSTLDSESSDRGSNPRETFSFCAKPRALAAWAVDLHLRLCSPQRAAPKGVCVSAVAAWGRERPSTADRRIGVQPVASDGVCGLRCLFRAAAVGAHAATSALNTRTAPAHTPRPAFAAFLFCRLCAPISRPLWLSGVPRARLSSVPAINPNLPLETFLTLFSGCDRKVS